MPFSFSKDPQAVLDYTLDFTKWLPEGDTITSATVTPEAGLTKDSDSHTDTSVTAWLSGGEEGSRYKVVYHVVTAEGREDDRTLVITIRHK